MESPDANLQQHTFAPTLKEVMSDNTPSYTELKERIAALEAQARMIEVQERNQQIQAILVRMKQHGIDIADLRKHGRSRSAD